MFNDKLFICVFLYFINKQDTAIDIKTLNVCYYYHSSLLCFGKHDDSITVSYGNEWSQRVA